MSANPSHAVLLTEIMNLKEMVQEIKSESKLNTEFRLQAKGMMSACSGIGAIIGGIMVFAIDKIWGLFFK